MENNYFLRTIFLFLTISVFFNFGSAQAIITENQKKELMECKNAKEEGYLDGNDYQKCKAKVLEFLSEPSPSSHSQFSNRPVRAVSNIKFCQMLKLNRDRAKREYEKCELKNELRRREDDTRRRQLGHIPDPAFNPPFQNSCVGWESRLNRHNQEILYKCD